MIALLATAAAGTVEVEGGPEDRAPPVVAAVTGASRDLALGAEYHGAGLSPALVHGVGGTVEVAVQGLASFAPAPGTQVVPAAPFLALGGVVGRDVRFGFGASGSFVAPTTGTDLGFGAGGRLGLAVGSPQAGRWFGFEADAGYTALRGALFDGPIADELWSAGGEDEPATDTVAASRAGLDAVAAWDVDATAVIFLRLGGAAAMASLGSPTVGAKWTWTGIEPRATLGAGYRPDPRTLVSLSARATRREADAVVGVPWTLGLGLARRIGPVDAAPVAAVAPAPAPALVVQVPKVAVARHPQLDCPEDTLPTGSPPPVGLEGWCVLVTPDGRVVRDGPYVRWSDPEHVAERGVYRADQRAGLWVAFAQDGMLVAEGNYADGQKDGPWKTWYTNGKPESDEQWLRGREDGVWRYYAEDGTLRVTGAWLNGFRDGRWLDYAPDGRPVRERVYRDGRLMHERLL